MYKRNNILSSLPPVTKWILLINGAIFLIMVFAESSNLGRSIFSTLRLYNFQSPNFNPYQLVTHMFMHGGLTHVFFNMFAVFLFGRVIESVWGSKRFFILYILSGLGAALLHMSITSLQLSSLYESIQVFKSSPSPDLFWEIIKPYTYMLNEKVSSFANDFYENPNNGNMITQATYILDSVYKELVNIPMVGASGAVFGVLAAFAVLFPNVELMLIFLPIPIKAKYFVPIYAIMELFLGVANFSGDNIAHFAHLGGAIVGFIIVFIWKRNQFKPM